MNKEIEIPEGYEVRIEGNKVVLTPKESEDERIRKAILGLTYLDGIEPILTKCSITARDIRTYLEKQKEPADGDFARGYDCGYECCLHSHGAEWFEKQKEQNNITIQKAFEASKGGFSLEEKRQASDYAESILPTSIAHGENEDEYMLHKVIEAAYIVGQKKQKSVECIEFNNEFENQVSHLLASTLNKEHNYTEGFVKYAAQSLLGYAKNELKSTELSDEGVHTRFAFYTYRDEPEILYLSNVYVEESSRNNGLGTLILKAAEKVAETIGAKSIRLKVKRGSPVKAWYRKHGYDYIAFEDGYDWLEKTLEYSKSVKQEWSEEDEGELQNAIDCLEYLGNGGVYASESGYDAAKNAVKFLKSLTERFNLQPNQE